MPATIDDLPELPARLYLRNGRLAPDGVEPFDRFHPDAALDPIRPELPADPQPEPHCPPSAERTIRTYWAFCTFPVITCHDLEAPDADIVARAVESNARRKEIAASDSRPFLRRMPNKAYFKLTHGPARPKICSVTAGPWSMHVAAYGQCSVNCQTPPDFWELTVPSVPDIYLSWYGTWDDAPLGQYPNLRVIGNELASSGPDYVECCPGFQRCGTLENRCVPHEVCRDLPDDFGPLPI